MELPFSPFCIARLNEIRYSVTVEKERDFMTKQQYEKWSSPFQKRESGAKILYVMDKTITGIVFLAYPVLLVSFAVMQRYADLISYLLVPAVSFLLVSLFRKKYSALRPYEVLDICPLIKKTTKGKSFPSRHVFSIFIIGMTFLDWNMWVGIIFLILGVLLAYIRVVGGVHFPKDVAAGALLGILCGLFYVIH